MPVSPARWLVETDWLAGRLDAPDLVVLDGSLHLPTAKRDARAEYKAAHIPGAYFFDIDAISDKSNPLPHMLPSPAQFSSQMRKMGIGDGTRVIAYDSEGLYSAARVWWMFRTMGHDDVAVLNGGLKKWRAEGRPLEDMEPPARTPRHFTARFNASLVRDRDDIKALIGHAAKSQGRGVQIVDARAAERFEGKAIEPRPGLRSGHIPGARSLPFGRLLQANGSLKPEADLRALFAEAGIVLDRPVVASCGSGVTAGVIAFALAQLGHPDAAVYDGSWSEWGADHALPIETGPAR